MSYAIKVRWAPDDWLFVTEEGDTVMTFETREEAEKFRKIWNGEASKVVEYKEEDYGSLQ